MTPAACGGQKDTELVSTMCLLIALSVLMYERSPEYGKRGSSTDIGGFNGGCGPAYSMADKLYTQVQFGHRILLLENADG